MNDRYCKLLPILRGNVIDGYKVNVYPAPGDVNVEPIHGEM